MRPQRGNPTLPVMSVAHMSHPQKLLVLALICAGCGAADLREPAGEVDAASTPEQLEHAIERLVTHCDSSCPPEERLALARRLLDLAQQARMRSFEAEYRASTSRDASAREAAHAEGLVAAQRANGTRAQAVALLRVTIEDHTTPPSPTVETALLELLMAVGESGARDEMITIAERIVHDAPARPIAAQAWLAIGERAFEDAALDRARDAYLATAAVPGGDAQLAVYAKYKLAWVYLNLSEFRLACTTFQEVAQTAAQPAMAREARRDFLRALEPLRLNAAEDVAEIRAVARDDQEAEVLAQRYEAMLRDVGDEARAIAFHTAWRAR